MKNHKTGNLKEKLSGIKSKIKSRDFIEPALLILIVCLILGGFVAFSMMSSTKQVKAESSNAEMISELNDINSYLNELKNFVL